MIRIGCIAALLVVLVNRSPAVEPPSVGLPIHEEAVDGFGVEPGQQLATARAAFLALDLPTAGGEIRKTAKNLRDAATDATDETRNALHEAAMGLETLEKRIANRSVDSVHELDHAFARAYHALARHQFATGQQLWSERMPRQAGQHLRAAADNLERAAVASGHRLTDATVSVFKESRNLSGKLVEGMGYAADDVGRVFEGVGHQVEHIGQSIAKGTARRPAPIVVPR